MDDELTHVHPREASAQEAPEQRQRQRSQRDELPPEEVVRDGRGLGTREGESPVQHGPGSRNDGRDQDREEDSTPTRRRLSELAHEQQHEDRREEAVGDDAEEKL